MAQVCDLPSSSYAPVNRFLAWYMKIMKHDLKRNINRNRPIKGRCSSVKSLSLSIAHRLSGRIGENARRLMGILFDDRLIIEEVFPVPDGGQSY